MNLTEFVHPSLFEEDTFQVDESQAASQIGSGALRVLATPVLISVMEKTSHRLLARFLPEGYSSVGIQIESLRHMAPTPMGNIVRVRSEIISVDNRTATFKIEAWDEVEKISEGTHVRAVIDIERFMKRVAGKQSNNG